MKLFACLHHVIMSSSTRAHFFLLHPFRVHIFTIVEIYGIKGKSKFQFNKVVCQFCMEWQNIAGFVYNSIQLEMYNDFFLPKTDEIIGVGIWSFLELAFVTPFIRCALKRKFFAFKQTNDISFKNICLARGF